MSLSKNLKYLRKQKKYSQEYLAETLGYKSFTTIQKWESGITEPSLSKVKKLSEMFHISMDELLSSDITNKSSNISKSIKIPVFENIITTSPISMNPILGYEEIDNKTAQSGTLFALKITEDKMEPRMFAGDIVIARKQDKIDNGDIAVIVISENITTVKKVQMLDNAMILIPFNMKYAPITYTAKECEDLSIKIIGKVIECRQKYELQKVIESSF